MTYFDHNATTPLLPVARAAWIEATETLVGNPSSPHRLGARAESALNLAREKFADFLGCDPLDVVWTSGATESNNTVIHHVARALEAPASIWVSAIEHPSLLEAARLYFPDRHRLIPVRRTGVVDLDWLRGELLGHRPALVAVLAANNETGVLQPWREILALCRERGVPFCCDAAQWMGKLPAQGLGDCDFVTGSAHKFGGPRGVGFLKCPPRGLVHPLLIGGSQEDGRRAGTENVPGILAMVAALEFRERQLSAQGHLTRLKWRTSFESELPVRVPGTQIVGTGADRLWNTVFAVMPDLAGGRRWIVKLDKAGYAVSTGSACASGHEKGSQVLAAMGYSADESSRALRFSSGWESAADDWDGLAAALSKLDETLRTGTSSAPAEAELDGDAL